MNLQAGNAHKTEPRPIQTGRARSWMTRSRRGDAKEGRGAPALQSFGRALFRPSTKISKTRKLHSWVSGQKALFNGLSIVLIFGAFLFVAAI